jgi:glycosyltransferase involved in cell wall biosynthesis
MRLLILELGYSAGTETVVVQLARAWLPRVEHLILAAASRRHEEYLTRGLPTEVDFASLEWPSGGWRRANRVAARLAFRHRLSRLDRLLSDWRLADIAREHRATHVFVPCIFSVAPRRLPRPFGVMAMDLAWQHFPGGFPGRTRAWLDAQFTAWLEAADIVFPVSDSTTAEIGSVFPAYAAKLCSVPHGSAGPRALAPSAPASPPVFFCPASVTANKNHLLLLQACARLYRAGHDFKMVLTGRDTAALQSVTPHARPAIETPRAFFHEHRELFAGRVVAPGFVSDQDIESLYATALRVVLPSAYEGFGLPLLEAFERGVPVICSGIPPFREQIARYAMNDLAAVVDPLDEVTLADAMAEALSRPAPARPDAQTHRDLLTRWTWDHAAEAYLKALARA